ncbi:MAG: undecaprenyl/decaprenyl-phosphate alpha-N-acetylglucosaminyl 1-phosphate transferase, partial [Clostridiales Family XIII bacterium]|nr:undecaprenyl/decaprenyl-phosphate alpha-N-acetylglucosaminyl 1-phosphate transferase [Clostridiales Family XIII bacterium]
MSGSMTDIAVLRILVFLCIIGAFFLTWIFTPLSKTVARRIGAIDVPQDGRRMHKTPVPRFGGLAIFLSTAVFILLIRFVLFPQTFLAHERGEPTNQLLAVLVGGAVIFAAGAVDDVRPMRARTKLFCQIVCGIVTFLLGIRIDNIAGLHLFISDSTVGGYILSLLLTVVWVVAIINTINLIDGMDGLAAGVSGIASLSIAYAGYIHGQYVVTLLMCAVAGAALGFLPSNFFPAKVIMGDCGA